MASSSGLRVFLLLVAGCTHAPDARPARPSLNETKPVEAQPVEAQPVEAQPLPAAAVAADCPRPATAAMGPLSASPGHQVLEWLVDVIAHRKGDVSHDELVEHFDKKLLGPVSTTNGDLYLATHDRRWNRARRSSRT
jgi:hypothetical protein